MYICRKWERREPQVETGRPMLINNKENEMWNRKRKNIIENVKTKWKIN